MCVCSVRRYIVVTGEAAECVRVREHAAADSDNNCALWRQRRAGGRAMELLLLFQALHQYRTQHGVCLCPSWHQQHMCISEATIACVWRCCCCCCLLERATACTYHTHTVQCECLGRLPLPGLARRSRTRFRSRLRTYSKERPQVHDGRTTNAKRKS